MTENTSIEKLLKKAPRPSVPAHLLERLDADIVLPESCARTRGQFARPKASHWLPAISIAASGAALAIAAVAIFWPTTIAYSFEHTIQAIRDTYSVHYIHRYRFGPGQPTDAGGGVGGVTSFHPANPFLAVEIRGEEGLRFVGTVSDDRGKREISGTAPVVFVEAPEGDFFMDIRSEDGERVRFEIALGNLDMMTESTRMGLFLSADGDVHRIIGLPGDMEDIEEFLKQPLITTPRSLAR